MPNNGMRTVLLGLAVCLSGCRIEPLDDGASALAAATATATVADTSTVTAVDASATPDAGAADLAVPPSDGGGCVLDDVFAESTFEDDTSDWCYSAWSSDLNACDSSGELSEASPPVPDGGDPKQCTLQVVGGIIQQCCKDPYSGTKNCTNFACQFHNLCNVNQVSCKTVTISCSAKEGHALNEIYVPGDGWCLIEPQNGHVYKPCSNDPDHPDPAAVAAACAGVGGKDGGTVTRVCNAPIAPNTDPMVCRRQSDAKGGSWGQCTGCCGDYWWYKYCRNHNVRGCDVWLSACIGACRGLPIK